MSEDWAKDMDKDQAEHPERWGMRLDDHGNPVEARVTIPDEPPPIPNDSVPVWELVIKDMQERDQVGRERYGTPLQVGNGRNHLVDAYQESLDKVVYLRAAIEDGRLHPPIDEEALALELYRRAFNFGTSAMHVVGITRYYRDLAADMFKVMREEIAARGK